MKFFKCHTQKMKDDKIIRLQDKFNDIGPDAFDGLPVECIILADTTKFIRNYAFSGTGKCKIYLPRAVEEIEPYAFENIHPETVFYCVKGSYAEKMCQDSRQTYSTEVNEIFSVVEEQERAEKERLEAERRKKEREEAERREKERAEAERLRKEKERAEKERLEAERIRKEQEEAERKKKEQEEAERRKKEQEEAERLRKEQERAEKERLEAERLRKQQEEAERRKEENPSLDVYIYDDKNGLKRGSINYNDLPPEGVEHIDGGCVYMHYKYVNGVMEIAFIDKQEYQSLVDSKKEDGPKPMACPFCSREITDTDTYCPYCGSKVKNIKICGRCGSSNDLGDNFCIRCGNRLPQA